MRRRVKVNPRLTVHADGSATLSGIPAERLLDILRGAWLYTDDHAKEEEAEAEPIPEVEEWPGHRRILERNARSDKNWRDVHQWILRQLLDRRSPEAESLFGGLPCTMDKRVLRERARERQIINAVLVEAMGGADVRPVR